MSDLPKQIKEGYRCSKCWAIVDGNNSDRRRKCKTCLDEKGV